MIIDKKDFDKLYSDDITKKDYDRIISDIETRFGEIVELIWKKKHNAWYGFGNCDYDSEDSAGVFDPYQYKTEIHIGGLGFNLPDPWGACAEPYIPTRWLWTNDKDILKEFNDEVKKANQKKKAILENGKQEREERKLRKERFKEIIKSKLTPEELKYIKFK
jgi:hypothetical protein